MAAADQTHRVAPGGAVEGLGHGGAPVHHQGLLVLAGHGQPAEVEGLPVGQVDAPEAQGLAPQVELLDPVEGCPHDHVALRDGLGRATPLAKRRRQSLASLGPKLVDAFVGSLDVGLLGLKLRM